MVIDIEILNKVKAQLRWGDKTKIAQRLGISREVLYSKLTGKSQITEKDILVIKQVVTEREALEGKIMDVDIETLNKVKAQLKYGDHAEVAKRLGLSRYMVFLKLSGKSRITEKDILVIKQVVTEREAREGKIMDVEMRKEVKARFKYGDHAEIARRLGLSRYKVYLKLSGKSQITEKDILVIKQVVTEREALEGKIMDVDIETLNKVKAQLKYGDHTEVAKRLRLSWNQLNLKLSGKYRITEKDILAINQVIAEREARQRQIMQTLKSLINE